MTFINEMFIRSVDIRNAVRMFMIGNSYTEIATMTVEAIRFIKMRNKN